MDTATTSGPWRFELANWGVEEPPAEVWVPTGLPVECYVPIDIFGTCDLQAYVHESSGGHQMVEPEASRPSIPSNKKHESSQRQGKKVVDMQNTETMNSNKSSASGVLEQVKEEFRIDIKKMSDKMHRYPASLRTVHKCYTMPRIVAIGPYHHRLQHLKQTAKVKHVAACHCVGNGEGQLWELYRKVAMAADRARGFYDKDVMAGIGYVDFRHMMFFDACFLVQFMRMKCGHHINQSLNSFMSPNRIDILHDVTLLENQLPWQVVLTVMRFVKRDSWKKELKFFVTKMRGSLQDQKLCANERAPLEWDNKYRPPHLLGLLRYYTVGRLHKKKKLPKEEEGPQNRSVSVSAMELAEMGISLTPNESGKIIDMALNQEGALFAELSLAPLSLDRNRASYLVNMAALELCTVQSFSDARVESSAVCSYLLLLAMLVYRVEDVHELRARGVLQGGGGLTNEEALSFFTNFQGLRLGRCYNRIMKQIEIYKGKKRMQTKGYRFYYRNKKTIGIIVTGVTAFATVVGTLASIKQAL